jgi:cytochrome c
MSRLIVAVMFTGCAVLSAQTPKVPARATQAEAQALLKKAIAHYEKVGRTQALADFTAAKAPFKDRDLYVFCVGPDRKVVSHGADKTQVGVDIDTVKDVDGKLFAVEAWKAGSRSGGGTVEYKWQNPVTKQVEAKVSFVAQAGKDVCGVGAYK